MRGVLRFLLVLALLAGARPALAEPLQRLFYEATPGDAAAGAPFAARHAFAVRVGHELVPAVLRAAGHDPRRAETTVTVGGWQLRTNPSLHTALAATDGEADRLAAAFGYVLRQDAVLVTEMSERDGGTGYVLLHLPHLTPERAQRFFLHAAGVAAGLGGGYTAFGDELLFLNVRGDDGAPYGGLSDPDFAAALRRAAAGFVEEPVTVHRHGTADARFIANDWSAAPDGEAYARRLGPALTTALRPLRDRHAALLDAAFPAKPSPATP